MTTQQGNTAPPAGRSQGPGKMPTRWWLWFGLMLLLNFLVVSYLFPGPEAPVEVPYTLFREQVEAGNVEEISSRGDAIEGTFEEPVTYPPEGENRSRTSTRFDTALPSFTDPGLEQLLIDNGVEISSEPLEQPRSWLQTLLFSFGPALLLIGLFIWLSRRAAGQGGGLGGALSSLGRSRARRYDHREGERVTFEDVAGIEEAENELVEIVDLRWGMSDELDTVALAPRESTFLGGGSPGSWSGDKPYSEETAQAIDAEVRRIIRESHEEARRLLAEHRGELDALAQTLLERETLDEKEILAVTGFARAPRLEDGKRSASQAAPDANQNRWDLR